MNGFFFVVVISGFIIKSAVIKGTNEMKYRRSETLEAMASNRQSISVSSHSVFRAYYGKTGKNIQ